MPKQNYSDITVVLDRSGSMGSILTDTIGGFNTFVEGQRSEAGEATISLIQFNEKYSVAYEAKDIKSCELLTKNNYVPRGMTALYDAVGKTITRTGERLAAMKEEDRPEKVIFVIMTDGEENSSREWSNEKIQEMVKHQTEKFSWEFIFLGANIDAKTVGSSIGIKPGYSMTFAASSDGMKGATYSMGRAVSNLRGMDVGTYTAQACCATSTVFDAQDMEIQAKAGVRTEATA